MNAVSNEIVFSHSLEQHACLWLFCDTVITYRDICFFLFSSVVFVVVAGRSFFVPQVTFDELQFLALVH